MIIKQVLFVTKIWIEEIYSSWDSRSALELLSWSRAPLSPVQAQESLFGEPAVNRGNSQAGLGVRSTERKGGRGKRIGSSFNWYI